MIVPDKTRQTVAGPLEIFLTEVPACIGTYVVLTFEQFSEAEDNSSVVAEYVILVL